MKTYVKPELKELVLAPQETISDLEIGTGSGYEIIVPDDYWNN